MTGRRKGTPCACSDDCGCSSSKGKCIRAINNISPDPNGDFSVNAGTGIIISGDENGIVIANGMPDPASLIAGDNIEITAIGDDLEIALTQDPVINGDLTVNGDIIQNGAAYETHAEHIYTADDYIIMRDGAISALSAGDYSGFQVKLYDGVNDGRLVIDNSGTARVGDVGDEQPLLTRDESADLTDHEYLIWDSTNEKAITSGIPNLKLYNATNGTIAQQTVTKVTYSLGTNNYTDVFEVNSSSITLKKSGAYLISQKAYGNVPSANRVELSINVNGSAEFYRTIAYYGVATNNIGITNSFIMNANANDVIYAELWSGSGYTIANAGNSNSIDIVYLG